MENARVLVTDLHGNEWEVAVDPELELAVFAKRLADGGAVATAEIADGHFVVIPHHGIARVEVVTGEALAARFDSRSEPRE